MRTTSATIYFPLIDGPGVEFVGEINEREKTKFLGEAAALLFPVDWPEPFGLVMIEAMACGTPVLAFRCGVGPRGHRGWRHRQNGRQRGGSRRGASGNLVLRPPRGAATI